MNKYLVVYIDASGGTYNAYQNWACISQENIDNFEDNYDDEQLLKVINIIKLDE